MRERERRKVWRLCLPLSSIYFPRSLSKKISLELSASQVYVALSHPLEQRVVWAVWLFWGRNSAPDNFIAASCCVCHRYRYRCGHHEQTVLYLCGGDWRGLGPQICVASLSSQQSWTYNYLWILAKLYNWIEFWVKL